MNKLIILIAMMTLKITTKSLSNRCIIMTKEITVICNISTLLNKGFDFIRRCHYQPNNLNTLVIREIRRQGSELPEKRQYQIQYVMPGCHWRVYYPIQRG